MAPTEDRLPLLDALRGVALCGIWLANLLSFAGYYVMTPAQLAALPTAAIDRPFIFLIKLLLEGKFYSLFCLLFGTGVALQLARLESRGQKVAPFLLRRMAVLGAIGFLHLHFVWHGDILTLYALLGLLLIPFCRGPSQRLLLLAAILMVARPLLQGLMMLGGFDPTRPFDALSRWVQESAGAAGRSLFELRSSSHPAEVFLGNLVNALQRPGRYLQTARPAYVFSAFLIGLCLGRRLFARQPIDPKTLRRVFWSGLLLGGIGGTVYAAVEARTHKTFSLSALGLLQSAGYAIGVVPLSLSYAGGLSLLWDTKQGRRLLGLFSTLGRLALTHYLCQSFIGLGIFYGYGLNLMGRVGFIWLLPIWVAVLIAQGVLGALWLRRFRHGPVEWLWRRLSYGRPIELSLPSAARNRAEDRAPTILGISLAVLLGGSIEARAEPRAAPAALPAGPRFTLTELLAVAIAHSPAILRSGVELRIAEARVVEARGTEDFVFDFAASVLLSRREPVPGQPLQQTAAESFGLRSALARQLPIGGRVSLRLGADFSRTAFDVMVGAAPQSSEARVFSPSISLDLLQPVLRGAGMNVTRSLMRRAVVARDALTLQREATASAIVRDVIQAYWELSYTTAEQEIRRQSVRLAAEQLRVVAAQIAVGKAPAAAQAEVEAALAQREDELLLVERSVQDRALALRLLTGLPASPDALVPADRPVPPLETPDPGRELMLALSRNPQLQHVRAEGRAATIDVEVTKNGMLPQLDLSLSASLFGYADDPGKSLRQLVSLGTFSVQGGLTFSTAIERRTAQGARDAALGVLRKARLNEEEITAQIRAAVLRAVSFVRSARDRNQILGRATELAQLNLEAERARYQVGRATSFDVLRRQDELAQAQLRTARARVDSLSATAALHTLTGEILSRHGLVVRGRAGLTWTFLELPLRGPGGSCS